MIEAAHKIDLLENSLVEMNIEENSFRVDVGAFSIESFKFMKDLSLLR